MYCVPRRESDFFKSARIARSLTRFLPNRSGWAHFESITTFSRASDERSHLPIERSAPRYTRRIYGVYAERQRSVEKVGTIAAAHKSFGARAEKYPRHEFVHTGNFTVLHIFLFYTFIKCRQAAKTAKYYTHTARARRRGRYAYKAVFQTRPNLYSMR